MQYSDFMQHSLQVNQEISYQHLVTNADTAAFEVGQVHPVYATFALGRDAEWTTRQFVLLIKTELQEGIGTKLNIVHHSPAFIGETVHFTAKITSFDGYKLCCTFEAKVANRLIATGSTEQKIMFKEKINKIFNNLKNASQQPRN